MEKRIKWIADSKEVLADFPDKVRKEMGFALYCEEIKVAHPAIKPLKGFKHAVREITSSYRGDTFRTVYVVNLGNKLYVLHVFKKKSKSGKETPEHTDHSGGLTNERDNHSRKRKRLSGFRV